MSMEAASCCAACPADECGIDIKQFPWETEWVEAREFHEMRRITEPENKHLYDRIYGVRGQQVELSWAIAARGMSQ